MIGRKKRLERKIRQLGPWFHQIDLGTGLKTRDVAPSPGPQPVDHPRARWTTFENAIPESLDGVSVLDIGCADGFFAIELARRGAHVTAIDLDGPMIRRLSWAAKTLGLRKRIEASVGRVETLPVGSSFDVCLFLGLLYHLRDPLSALERIAQVTRTLYLESATTPGDEPYLYFKPPQEGVHYVPKWFPTKSCVEAMLRAVGFDRIRFLEEATPNRVSLVAERD